MEHTTVALCHLSVLKTPILRGVTRLSGRTGVNISFSNRDSPQSKEKLQSNSVDLQNFTGKLEHINLVIRNLIPILIFFLHSWDSETPSSLTLCHYRLSVSWYLPNSLKYFLVPDWQLSFSVYALNTCPRT